MTTHLKCGRQASQSAAATRATAPRALQGWGAVEALVHGSSCAQSCTARCARSASATTASWHPLLSRSLSASSFMCLPCAQPPRAARCAWRRTPEPAPHRYTDSNRPLHGMCCSWRHVVLCCISCEQRLRAILMCCAQTRVSVEQRQTQVMVQPLIPTLTSLPGVERHEHVGFALGWTCW
jgi:hypothetical protein